MTGTNQNVLFGAMFLVVGLALVLTIDPWFIGLVFILLGAQRLIAELTASGPDKDR